MIYEFRTYTLKPRSLAEVEKRQRDAALRTCGGRGGDRPRHGRDLE